MTELHYRSHPRDRAEVYTSRIPLVEVQGLSETLHFLNLPRNSVLKGHPLLKPVPHTHPHIFPPLSLGGGNLTSM